MSNKPITEEDKAKWKNLYLDFIAKKDEYYPKIDSAITALFKETTKDTVYLKYNQKGGYLAVEFITKDGVVSSTAFDQEDLVFYAFYATGISITSDENAPVIQGALFLGRTLESIFIEMMNEAIVNLRDLVKEWDL